MWQAIVGGLFVYVIFAHLASQARERDVLDLADSLASDAEALANTLECLWFRSVTWESR